ncbi:MULTISPECIES: phosphotransferase [Streptomyces]|nr:MULTISPECIES: phosphotransferase [Streptomyces]
MANSRAVFRRGDRVDRPAPPQAKALHAHLAALRAGGFDGVPEPLAIGPDGREQLGFVPGDVPLPPFPDWAMTEAALRSVGALLRRLHGASAALPPPDASTGWSTELADPEGGSVLCHNDACLENVVFREGRAVALIDFDLAAPGRPLWDVAQAARYWAPMRDPRSRAGFYPEGLDAIARARVLADGYGLTPRDRADLPEAIERATAVGRAFVARRVANGDPVYRRAVAEGGGWARWDRIQRWQRAQREALRGALLE